MSMINKGNEQEIGNVGDGASVNQAGGNITINQGMQAGDVVTLVHALVKSELALYQHQAETTARERLKDFVQQLESTLAEQVADKIDRFHEPSMQFATREAAVGYIKSGDINEREALVDLLIERVKEDEHTSKQMLIDEAIKILPKLSKESLAILTLLTYNQLLRTEGLSTSLDAWFKCINPVLDVLPYVSKLDIVYLSQAECVTGLNGIWKTKSWIKKLIENYNIYFRHNPSAQASKPLIEKMGIQSDGEGNMYFRPPYDMRLAMLAFQLFDLNKDGSLTLQGINTKTYESILKDNGLYNLMPDIFSVINQMPLMSEQEVINKLSMFNSNWPLAFKLFNESPLNGFQLKPVGMYIGSRQLSKLTNIDVSMDLFLNSDK